MAENIETKVLSVDVGGAITNIKEYKKHIEELKGTLLGLEKGTEEYNKVQVQLREEQDKLKEALKDAGGLKEYKEYIENLKGDLLNVTKGTDEWIKKSTELTEAQNVLNDLLKDSGGLKEYKQYVDNLKGSLLNLDKTSEEYKQKSIELTEAQEHLNEVMAIGKNNGEFLEGSYNYLSKQMSDLKKEWKATGDEAERARLGEQINSINNQLKDMDASVGVFSRNVGNYSQAYEEAFKTVIGSLDDVDGLLGEVAGNVNSLFPLIKQTTAAATAGLKGIKKAIATTGIGLLIVAVGELAAHFDDVRRAVGVTDDKFQEFKSTVTGVLKTIVAGVAGVGNSILQFLITPIKTFVEVVKGAGTLIKDVFTGKFKKIKEDAVSAGNAVTNALNNGIQFKANFNKGKEFADNLIQNIQDEVKAKQKSDSGKVEVDINPILNRLEEFGLGDIDMLKLQADRRKEALTKQYQEEKALLEKNHIDTSTLTAEYTQNMLKADDEYNAAVLQKMQDADAEQINQLLATSLEEEEILQGLFDDETMMQEARNIIAAALDEKRKEQEKKDLEERKKNIESFVSSTSDIIGMVADAWESSIKSQVESGKISEEEGKKQFERVKALETAVAIINTLAAGIEAFKGITKASGGWALAAAIAQMVATVGVGMAQVAKIQSTQLGTKSTQVTSVTTPNLGSIVNEYQPQYVSNITNNTELDNLANALQKNPIKAYVVESDITNAQGLTRQREDETSW